VGILVQREFSVAIDDRAEFERQSRLGVWENMRYNGAQMIAYGAWAFGGPGEVVVTNSVYENFDHWTATRPWGFFASSPGHIEETKQIRAIFAGRPRLIRHSRATIIDYDDEASEPQPRFRNAGEPLAPLPPTFGRQSIVAQSEWLVEPGMEEEFLAVTRSVLWPWLTGEGARPLIFGRDPLAAPGSLVTMTAFRDISEWHRLRVPNEAAENDVRTAWRHRDSLLRTSTTRLLMVATDYGATA
jgi:hypothetical protein